MSMCSKLDIIQQAKLDAALKISSGLYGINASFLFIKREMLVDLESQVTTHTYSCPTFASVNAFLSSYLVVRGVCEYAYAIYVGHVMNDVSCDDYT